MFVVHNYFSSTVHFCQLESRFGYVSTPPKAFRFETLSGDMDLTRDKATVLLSPLVSYHERTTSVRRGEDRPGQWIFTIPLLRPVIWIYTLPLRIASCALIVARNTHTYTCVREKWGEKSSLDDSVFISLLCLFISARLFVIIYFLFYILLNSVIRIYIYIFYI